MVSRTLSTTLARSLRSSVRRPVRLPFTGLYFLFYNENFCVWLVVIGTFAVAGNSNLAEPIHRSHYPFKWSYRRDRGTSPCPDCDCGCVDRRWLPCRDGYVKWHGPLPRAY